MTTLGDFWLDTWEKLKGEFLKEFPFFSYSEVKHSASLQRFAPLRQPFRHVLLRFDISEKLKKEFLKKFLFFTLVVEPRASP
ncbi:MULTISPECIES: hypothetical protein [unclassified Achromobacter]|uniref:hypothetical protein n=1 Tax=unclassified Achromobacter TaxID=2626865 RepID=UPI000B518E0D|nr:MULTISPECIES: hypothetical protein [unclassified Achromobacter]OWT71595.1 hypothetical protein CEY05_25770 [Achromobacter sp. HZ34]OWT73252.1 hypothetical protein CEY04_24605 [Achromobacter sp. HZ28]